MTNGGGGESNGTIWRSIVHPSADCITSVYCSTLFMAMLKTLEGDMIRRQDNSKAVKLVEH